MDNTLLNLYSRSPDKGFQWEGSRIIMERLTLTSLGQICDADITFGDLTVFVGEHTGSRPTEDYCCCRPQLPYPEGAISLSIPRSGEIPGVSTT